MKFSKNITILIMSLILGVLCGISRYWYMTGLFPDVLRELPKEKRIALFRSIGLKSTPERLRDILVSMYPNQPPEEHEQAHLIGETAYIRFGPKGFDYCDSSFTFACFHGVIFQAIKTHGYDENVLKGLADECNAAGKNDTVKVSCAHGIGHGVMWVKNYSLVPSYELCDRIFTNSKLRFFCWDGVSMENVVRRGEIANGLPLIPWKPDNMYYPCDSIPAQYQPACAREHLFLLRLAVFNRDTQASIDYCMVFSDAEVHRECFGALGGALNQDDPTKTDYITSECLKVPKPYDIYCIGRAAALHGYAGDKETGELFCEAIIEEEAKKGCIGAVEQAAASLYMLQSE